MNIFIRKFEESDRTELLKMMEVFYSSEAVSTNGSKEIFNKDFDACVFFFVHFAKSGKGNFLGKS